MDDEEQKPGPKISITEAILIGIPILIIDILEFIPLVGDLGSIVASPVILYLYLKGVGGLFFLFGEGLDLIPGVQEFPCKTLAWVITVGIDRFAPKEVSEKLEKVGETLQAGKGAPGGAVGEAEGVVAAEGGAVTAGARETAAETGAAGAGGAETVERGGSRPSEARVAGEKGGGVAPGTEEVERGGEGGAEAEGAPEPGEAGEETPEAEQARRGAEAEREMEMGAEISPEEEAEEAVFNPEELQFKESKSKSEKDEEEDEEDEEEIDKAA